MLQWSLPKDIRLFCCHNSSRNYLFRQFSLNYFQTKTNTEQCEEVSNLKLEDGTTKIFLNMSSKNAAPELISMLQYMKDTYLENPEIIVKDSRLLELDRIVSEVRESDEWEAVKMNILEIGKEFGAKEKLKELIQKKLKRGYSLEEIADMLEEELELIQQLASEMGEK